MLPVEDSVPVTASVPPVVEVEADDSVGSVRVEVLALGGGKVGYPLKEDDVLLPVIASVPAVE